MIRHIHVNECDSTQDLLKEQINNNQSTENVLVSCEHQTLGRGRGENKWTAMKGTLCFSMNLTPHSVMSYTAIEVSVLIAKFFKTKNQELKLKWPNDLWDTKLNKCGGILIQGSQNNFYAGIGINLFSSDKNLGSVFEAEFEIEKQRWAYEIAEFILNNRYTSSTKLRQDWLHSCGHLNQEVEITETGEKHRGMFLGLGEYGEALVLIDNETQKFFNGSLRPINR